jgi:hypothetical protein
MKSYNFFLLLICIAPLNLFACNHSATTQTSRPFQTAPSTSLPTSNSTPEPATTEVFRQNIAATATDIQLPYNLVTESSEYCQSPYAILPMRDTENLSEDEIAYKLVDIWLSRYKKPEAHPYCRIDDYTIDKVYYDERTPYLPLEPKGDIMRVVIFSVKLIQVPADWMALSGEIDQNNWLHTAHAIAIFKTTEGYTMEFANP